MSERVTTVGLNSHARRWHELLFAKLLSASLHLHLIL